MSPDIETYQGTTTEAGEVTAASALNPVYQSHAGQIIIVEADGSFVSWFCLSWNEETSLYVSEGSGQDAAQIPGGGSRHRLIIVGAGPKGVGIAAKQAVLRALGWQVPEVVVIDQIGVAANWTGQNGYTDGHQLLGTLPEKDVGFPYRSDEWGSSNEVVNQFMLRLSWGAFLTTAGGGDLAMTYADWIDRGRPQPAHRQWASYLGWVADQVHLDLRIGQVTRIDLVAGRWRLTCERDQQRTWVDGDGLVITGPGEPYRDIPGSASASSAPGLVTDGRQLWRERRRFDRATQPLRVCVVGSGETAAAAAMGLLQMLPAGSSIDICSRQGVVYSRGESFAENHLYSSPGGWTSLTIDHRQEFVRRTDRGVFSIHAHGALAGAHNVRTVVGEVIRLDPDAHAHAVNVHVEYNGRRHTLGYDSVVVATGFDPLWFESLFTGRARATLADALGRQGSPRSSPRPRNPAALDDHAGSRELIKQTIGHDLAVRELFPRLHLPMLAALEQGPGFPNLSCLGLLSDRVLRPYCSSPRIDRSVLGAWPEPELDTLTAGTRAAPSLPVGQSPVPS